MTRDEREKITELANSVLLALPYLQPSDVVRLKAAARAVHALLSQPEEPALKKLRATFEEMADNLESDPAPQFSLLGREMRRRWAEAVGPAPQPEEEPGRCSFFIEQSETECGAALPCFSHPVRCTCCGGQGCAVCRSGR